MERAFLRIVTRGHSALEQQIERCEIAEYDVTGWCDVDVLGGPPMSIDMIDGPHIDLSALPHVPVPFAPTTGTQFISSRRGSGLPTQVSMDGPPSYVGIILWMNERGFLYSIEIVQYGGGYIVDPYTLFVTLDATTPSPVRYPST